MKSSQNDDLLEKSIELVRQVRDEIQSSTEDSIIERMDTAILMLESIQANGREYSMVEILNILGSVIELLPTIISIIKTIK